MNIYRFLLTMPILFSLLFVPLQANAVLAQPLAASNACVTSSPTPATFTVKLCFTSPQDNAQLTGDVTVTVTATITGKTSGLQRMTFYLNGAYLLTDYQSPYTFTLPTTHWVDGSYTLSVEALTHGTFTTQRANLALNFANGIETAPVNNNQFHVTSGKSTSGGGPFVVAAVGDGAGGEVNATKVVKELTSINPDLLLYLGDVYEKGTFTEFYNHYGPQGTNFSIFRSITDPTVGNHEYTTGSAKDYFFYWDNIPSYYSFDAGGWHFIDLNSNGSYVPISSKSAQYQWLVADLAAHTQACTIVYYHEPVFNIGPEGSAKQMVPVWALLAQHHVSIVLNGHDHDYQRWVPLDGQGNPAPDGVTEFIAGGGGHGIQTFTKQDSRVAFSSDANPATFGALKLELNASGAAFTYINTAGSILDSGVIPCQKTTQVVPPASTVSTSMTSAAQSIPGGISAAAANETKVDLRWSVSNNIAIASGYIIYRDGVVLATVAGDVQVYTDSTAVPGVIYNYCVTALDQNGNSLATSAQVAVVTPDY